MKYVNLIFPNITQLAKFHIDLSSINIKMNSKAFTITGYMTEEQIVSACTNYGALLEVISTDEKD